MASHTFGALTLDLPGEWEDQTILTFVKRPKARMATAAVQDMNRNLIISRAWADGTCDVHDLAATHLEGLKAAIPDLEVLKEDTAEIAGAPSPLREVLSATWRRRSMCRPYPSTFVGIWSRRSITINGARPFSRRPEAGPGPLRSRTTSASSITTVVISPGRLTRTSRASTYH